MYLPGEYIAIDEELVKFRGRLTFKLFIKSKWARFGKLFSLCEDSGYCWNSCDYLGKNGVVQSAEDKELQATIGRSGCVVINLIKELYGSGRKLYVDNWYTSENLFKVLGKNKIAACGTAKANRISLPKSFTTEKIGTGRLFI